MIKLHSGLYSENENIQEGKVLSAFLVTPPAARIVYYSGFS